MYTDENRRMVRTDERRLLSTGSSSPLLSAAEYDRLVYPTLREPEETEAIEKMRSMKTRAMATVWRSGQGQRVLAPTSLRSFETYASGLYDPSSPDGISRIDSDFFTTKAFTERILNKVVDR